MRPRWPLWEVALVVFLAVAAVLTPYWAEWVSIRLGAVRRPSADQASVRGPTLPKQGHHTLSAGFLGGTQGGLTVPVPGA